MSDDLAMHGRADSLAASAGAARRLGALLFCAGLYAMLAQILLLRELLVAFYGNELTLGAALTAWLALIGAGSRSRTDHRTGDARPHPPDRVGVAGAADCNRRPAGGDGVEGEDDDAGGAG